MTPVDVNSSRIEALEFLLTELIRELIQRDRGLSDNLSERITEYIAKFSKDESLQRKTTAMHLKKLDSKISAEKTESNR